MPPLTSHPLPPLQVDGRTRAGRSRRVAGATFGGGPLGGRTPLGFPYTLGYPVHPPPGVGAGAFTMGTTAAAGSPGFGFPDPFGGFSHVSFYFV